MKKIAFYVEGQTELLFMSKLLAEIAGYKKIQIELSQFQGIGRPTRSIVPNTIPHTDTPQHYALIFDCMNDEGVKSRILDDSTNLFSQGYVQIVGLRDLYPKQYTDLARFEDNLINGVERNGRTIIPPLPVRTNIIVAVREVEDWFLSECNHYVCIDISLQNSLLLNVGFDTHNGDLTLRANSAAEDLKSIYSLVGKTYTKKKMHVERTINCLDYANLYLNIREKHPDLDKLITIIDNFLT